VHHDKTLIAQYYSRIERRFHQRMQQGAIPWESGSDSLEITLSQFFSTVEFDSLEQEIK